MKPLKTLAIAHLQLRLQHLHPLLHEAVEAQIARAGRLERQDLTPLCITEDEVLHLVDDTGQLLAEIVQTPVSDDELSDPCEAVIRDEARRAGLTLPLDALAHRLNLSAFEQFAILLCAAPELDRAYERIYAFLLDDLGRRVPSVELLSTLGAGTISDRIARRHALSRFGTLRRSGLLQARGDAESELRQELRLAEGLFDHLTGDGSDPEVFGRDPIAPMAMTGPALDGRIAQLAAAMRTGLLRAVGIWGPRESATEEAAHAFACDLGRRLRIWSPPQSDDGHGVSVLRDAIQEAATSGGLLSIGTDAFADPQRRDAAAIIASELARTSIPILLTGSQAWRPWELISAAPYAEIELDAPDLSARRSMWQQEMPELGAHEADEMAARLRLGRNEVRASIRMARSEAEIAGEAPGFAQMQRAAASMTGARSRTFATLIRPKRGPEDLILPMVLHRQVMEVAQFFRAWPTVFITIK